MRVDIMGLSGLFGLVLMEDTEHTIGHELKAELPEIQLLFRLRKGT